MAYNDPEWVPASVLAALNLEARIQGTDGEIGRAHV